LKNSCKTKEGEIHFLKNSKQKNIILWFCFCQDPTMCLIDVPSLMEKVKKRHFFSIYLISFTFALRTKKITFSFCKNIDKKIVLSLSRTKIIFSKFTFFTFCFNSKKNEKKYIKNSYNFMFLYDFECSY
jgi:hypothetical protein